MNIKATINQHPVASFIVLTLGLSFAAFFLPVPPEGAFAIIALMAVMIPTIVAFALVALIEDRQGVGDFLRESFRWRSPLKWYVIAFALGFVIHFGSSLLALLTGAIPAIEIAAPNATLVIIPIAALLEAIGWRGFALRRLLDRYSPFTATLIIGIPWALLHFALFLLFEPNVSPVAEGLSVLVFAFPLTWIFVRSGRSVLVATVLHSGLNAFSFVAAGIPPAVALWYIFTSGCLVVAVLIVIDRRMWFARPAETTVSATIHTGMSAVD
ncbi:MAG TPA: CPBP family intramembrane glutamic endopeptidase [Anaerolineae bacterium]|nr:CPBP family intramembrane glutamic endopeptidase [Anaerolineae bacterium]